MLLYILKDSQTRHYGFANENSSFGSLSKRTQSGKKLIFPPSAIANILVEILIGECSINYFQHLQLTSLSEQCSSSCSDTWHLGKSLKQKEHSTGRSEIAFSTARLWMQELRVMSTLQDSQLWPGANRVKSNGDAGLPKPCRYLLNYKKHLALIQLLEQCLPRQNYFYKACLVKTTKIHYILTYHSCFEFSMICKT